MTYPETILAALARSGRSAREVSIAAVGHESAIRTLKRGMDVRASTLMALCRELGLEFYVGPPRTEAAAGVRAATIQEGEPLPAWVTQLTDDLRSEIQQVAALCRSHARDAPEFVEESLAADVAWWAEPRESPGVCCVDCYEVGGRAPRDALTRVGCLAFHRSWFDRHRLDASQCAMVRVRGTSMAPALDDGSTILVNFGQRRRRSGGVFVVRVGDRLVVRRVRKDPGGWQLVGYRHDQEPRPWPDEAEILGQVRWGTSTF